MKKHLLLLTLIVVLLTGCPHQQIDLPETISLPVIEELSINHNGERTISLHSETKGANIYYIVLEEPSTLIESVIDYNKPLSEDINFSIDQSHMVSNLETYLNTYQSTLFTESTVNDFITSNQEKIIAYLYNEKVTLYANPFQISEKHVMVLAAAIKTGLLQSGEILAKSFSSVDALQPPTINFTGEYNTKTITIESTTPDVTIYYTTDGTEPSTTVEGSTKLYEAPFDVDIDDTGITVKALTLKQGMAVSSVSTQFINLHTLENAHITSEGEYEKTVTITSSTQGATIHYTTDGTTPSTTVSGSTKLYNGSFIATVGNETIKAIVIKEGMITSPISIHKVTLNTILTPTVVVKDEYYEKHITLACSTPNTTILYTTNGTEPATTAGGYTKLYTESFMATAGNQIIIAIAVRNDMKSSPTLTHSVALNTTEKPEIISSGDWEKMVTITTSTPNASILYTTDGSEPATIAGGSTKLYTESFMARVGSETIKAITVRDGMHKSTSTTHTVELNTTNYVQTMIKDNVLIITASTSGSTFKSAVWKHKQSDITKVKIEDAGVKIIPESNLYKLFDAGYYVSNAESFQKITSIEGWEQLDTSNVINMSYMFRGCLSLTDLDLSSFDTSNVTTMHAIFSDCTSLTNLDISNFNTSKVTTMSYMFDDCSSLTSLDITHFDTSKVTTMGAMFHGCSVLENLTITNFNTSNVTSMGEMFKGCSALEQLNLSNFITSNVTSMYSMFYGCTVLKSLDLSKFDTSIVTNMSSMFADCSSLTNLDLSKFDTTNVIMMGTIGGTETKGMFAGCLNLKELDLSNFNTSNVTDMKFMFTDCTALESLNLSNWNTQKVTSSSGHVYYYQDPMDGSLDMFTGCTALKRAKVITTGATLGSPSTVQAKINTLNP